MFTRCKHCATVFRVSADQLRAAKGQVRCGECSTVFNAMDALFDRAPDSDTASDDEPLSIEITSDQGDDRELLEAWSETAAKLGFGDEEEEPSETDQPEETSADEGEPEHTASGIFWIDIEEEDTRARIEAIKIGADIARGRRSTDRIQNAAAEPQQDELTPEEFFGATPPKRYPHKAWTIATVLAILLLGLQILHYSRNELARHPSLGQWVQGVYRSLGLSLNPEWSIKDYVIVKRGATNAPQVPGALVVQAMVSNYAPFPQPYPLIRLTLFDRWGEAVGERSFEPQEYLASNATDRQFLASGEDIQAEMLVLLPGEQATNYEVDVCLRTSGSLLRCANE